MPSHGWLHRNDGLSWTVCGVDIDPATRTRREEYSWVATMLWSDINSGRTALLDAATGYVNGWHMMPYIAATMGFDVHTIDMDERTLGMPRHDHIVRGMGNLLAIPYADNAVDTVLCISTLEHLAPGEVQPAIEELVRVARHRVIVTADEAGSWLPFAMKAAGLDIGCAIPFAGEHLSPAVYAVDARKG